MLRPVTILVAALVLSLSQQHVAYAGVFSLNVDYRYWAPDRGNNWVTSTDSKQDFYWSTEQRHSELSWEPGGTSAYEHEVHFYNYDQNAWATGASSWYSNMPDTRYLDPGFSQNPNEPTLEIGTTRADLITHQVWYLADAYSLYRYGTDGRVKLVAARGDRAHTCPYDWCVRQNSARIIIKYGLTWWYFAPNDGRVAWTQ